MGGGGVAEKRTFQCNLIPGYLLEHGVTVLKRSVLEIWGYLLLTNFSLLLATLTTRPFSSLNCFPHPLASLSRASMLLFLLYDAKSSIYSVCLVFLSLALSPTCLRRTSRCRLGGEGRLLQLWRNHRRPSSRVLCAKAQPDLSEPFPEDTQLIHS